MRKIASGHQRTSFLALLIAVTVLMVLGLAGRVIQSRFLLPTGTAQWIWAATEKPSGRPMGFYAVRDFDLAERPRTAHLSSQADEEAVIFINGIPVGTLDYWNRARLEAFDVSEMVRPGRNRLVAELRSLRGVGGFLLRLAVEGEDWTEEIVTDREWQVFRRSEPGVFNLQEPLPEAEPIQIWGAPPVGRWSRPRRPLELPTIDAVRVGTKAVGAQRFRLGGGGEKWRNLGKTNRSSPAIGPWVVFDWGEEIVAYIALRLPPRVGHDSEPIGLLFTSSELPVIDQSRLADYVIAMPDQRVWLDVTPRRFRYVAFAGLFDVSGAEAYLVDPQWEKNGSSSRYRQEGAFGLQRVDSGTPLEDEIWSELHRLTSITGRQGG